MDARTFEPDEPLPRVCKHCAWARRTTSEPPFDLACLHERTDCFTAPDETCDHWEERK
jgi:hypothetical protein